MNKNSAVESNTELNELILFKIKCLSNLLKRQIAKQECCGQEVEEFSQMQGCILGYVEAHGEVFQRELEKHFNMRRSTVTKALQNLEKNGYVTRQSVSSDARLKKIALTQKAKAIHDQVRQRIAHTESVLRKGLSEEQIRVFFEVAEIIAKNLKAEEKEEEKC